MSLSDLLAQKKHEIERLAASHGAYDVRVFGSAARGTERPQSDVDILVKLEAGRSLLDHVALKQGLEDLLGCPVDVVVEGGISPYLENRILSEAVPL